MSSPRSYEMQLLTKANAFLDAFSGKFNKLSFEARLQVLEGASSRLGGFSINNYHQSFRINTLYTDKYILDAGRKLLDEIDKTQIPSALALSTLAREPLKAQHQRTTGAYHTDFRLAMHLASLSNSIYHEDMRIIDPACGAGILIVALTLATCGTDRRRIAHWLSNSVFAADLSEMALRGALLSLASMTDDIEALCTMRAKWLCKDSLLSKQSDWKTLAPEGFDIVIGNPPWEKVKLSRHEYLKANGQKRHYGKDYDGIDDEYYTRERSDLSNYAKCLANKYSLLRDCEPDLYMAFVELFSQIVKDGGNISILVPAGLIRSQGTEALRKFLTSSFKNLSISVIENRARFFEIDTRFKFLALSCVKKHTHEVVRRDPIVLLHQRGTTNGIEKTGDACIGRKDLSNIRPDLTIPEVRSQKEWLIFLSMSKNSIRWDDDLETWSPKIVREVDMTKERKYFIKYFTPSLLPIIEGRMVQQHRFGAKGYVSGSGRKAIWKSFPIGESRLSPQFWICEEALSLKVRERLKNIRVGFCDITGQTNERTMMASIIPAGVVCGNKVPTILFPKDTSEDRLFFLTAIANSLPFDWLLRRVVTTTVNYFVLLSVPLPRIKKNSLPGKLMIDGAKELNKYNTTKCSSSDLWKMAEFRAMIDISCLIGYGQSYDELSIMINDFPLLDRGQPALPTERKSTITKDLLLLSAAKRFHLPTKTLADRVMAAKHEGAIPYIPSEVTMAQDNGDNEVLIYAK